MLPEFFPAYHARLLARAAPPHFSKWALFTRVIPANMAVDLDQFRSKVHFDNCTFAPGVAHVNDLWAKIVKGADYHANFGRLTHTVQDFYSHSNWVELHLDQCPIPTWDLSLGTLPSAIVSGTFFDAPRLCGPGSPTHAALNKDSPFSRFSPAGASVVDSGPNRGQSHFALAFDAAQRATRLQFDRLVEFREAD